MAQPVRGSLALEVRDSRGLPHPTKARLTSSANRYDQAFDVPHDGREIVRDLGYGVYQLTLSSDGFAPWSRLIEIRTAVAVHVSATLELAPLATKVNVDDSAALLDPNAIAIQYPIGRKDIGEELSAQPGRALFDLVAQQPGWIYESNGVLHPRGSEYDVQFVVAGLPVTQNRSPAFARPMESEDVQSMRVITAGYPAEYGRKLGGVVEAVPSRSISSGWHGQLDAEGGNFSTVNGAGALSYSKRKNYFSLRGSAFSGDRYLDPPVTANYTNSANAGGMAATYERDFSDSDHLRAVFTYSSLSYSVPNDLVQYAAGQRQNAGTDDTGGLLYYSHAISGDSILTLSGSIRSSHFWLTSNAASTPIIVAQQRGYTEGYARADLAGHKGRHDWKFGVDAMAGPVHEALQYIITDPSQYEPGTQSPFQFSDGKWDTEVSGFVQDQMRFGHWNMSVGLRFDDYRLVLHETSWSPRAGISRYIPAWNLLVHASYDRVFQTPAMENLLLASSPQFDSVNPDVLRLPVRPASGNFFEAGASKAFSGNLRLDANVFRRDLTNYSDDDVLLATGVSFPIAFASARITGEEVRLSVPRWGRFSGYVSYANQSGIAQGPVTGGLFIGSDETSGIGDTSKFAVSQDQRNTLSARIRVQATNRLWAAAAAGYGSGLPVEMDEVDTDSLTEHYGADVLSKVNLERGRVGPNFSLDLAGGAELLHTERATMELQFRATNLLDRLNVINFASVFSGTGVAVPRSFSARLRVSF